MDDEDYRYDYEYDRSGKQREEEVIRAYQRDERMMILVFAQWCVNHNLDPVELYKRAYPTQADNPELHAGIALTVSAEEAGPIADETLLNLLSMFGNDDLGFVVSEEMEKRKERKRK